MNHVSVKTRQHLWSGRRVMFDDADWDRLPDRLVTSPHGHTEQRAQLDALRRAVETKLTARQRDVFIAVALNEVPKLTLNDLLLAGARAPGCQAGFEFVDQ
jgi:RNA polymerase sigma-70 factor (ECF subfamily)